MALGDITIRSTALPDITVNILSKSSKSGTSIPLDILRPSFDVDLGSLGGIQHYAPYGEPTTTITVGLVVAIVLILGVIVFIARR